MLTVRFFKICGGRATRQRLRGSMTYLFYILRIVNSVDLFRNTHNHFVRIGAGHGRGQFANPQRRPRSYGTKTPALQAALPVLLCRPVGPSPTLRNPPHPTMPNPVMTKDTSPPHPPALALSRWPNQDSSPPHLASRAMPYIVQAPANGQNSGPPPLHPSF